MERDGVQMSEQSKRQRLASYHNHQQPGAYQEFHNHNYGQFIPASHMGPLFVDTQANAQGQNRWGIQHPMASPQPHGAMSLLSPNGAGNDLMHQHHSVFSPVLNAKPVQNDEKHNKYCHFCQHHKVKKTSSMNGCTNIGCIRRFCGHCLKVHLKDADTNKDGTPAARPGSANWSCPICRKACCCAKDVCTIDHRHCKTYRYRRRRKAGPRPVPAPAPATAPEHASPGVEAAGAMVGSEARTQQVDTGEEGATEERHGGWGFGGAPGVTLAEGLVSNCGVGAGAGECKVESPPTPPTATRVAGEGKMLIAEMASGRETCGEEWEAPVKEHCGVAAEVAVAGLRGGLIKEASGEDWTQTLREHHSIINNAVFHPRHAPPHGQGLMSALNGKGGYNGNGNFPLDGAGGVFGEPTGIQSADSSRDAWTMAKNDDEDAWGVGVSALHASLHDRV